MENDAADELHVVMNLYPGDDRSAGIPLLADMATTGFLDHRERFGQDLVQHLFGRAVDRLFEAVDLFEQAGISLSTE